MLLPRCLKKQRSIQNRLKNNHLAFLSKSVTHFVVILFSPIGVVLIKQQFLPRRELQGIAWGKGDVLFTLFRCYYTTTRFPSTYTRKSELGFCLSTTNFEHFRHFYLTYDTQRMRSLFDICWAQSYETFRRLFRRLTLLT